MKVFIAFLIIGVSLIVGHPIYKDRIVYPDDKQLKEIASRFGNIEADSKSLLDDPNLLKSENATDELLIDKFADTKLENGNYFQGDMMLTEDQRNMINTLEPGPGQAESDEDDPLGTRTGLIWAGFRWPKNSKGTVTVPYLIDKNQFSEY